MENANINKTQIPVAIDANLFTYLWKLANPRFDPNGEIMNKLKTRTLYVADYADKKFEELPPLLQDGYFGYSEENVDKYGNTFKAYFRLQDVFHLYELIINDKLQVYLTPSVFMESLEIYKNADEGFLKHFTVINVPNEKFDSYKKARNALADKYCEEGAMKSKYNGYNDRVEPETDAVIMAEASMAGLVFVTANVKHFIDDLSMTEGGKYRRANIIERVNNEMGYYFFDNYGKWKSVRPFSVESYYAGLRTILAGSDTKSRTIRFDSDPLDFSNF